MQCYLCFDKRASAWLIRPKRLPSGVYRYEPRITFIIVQKRHHTRFFAEDRCDRKARRENLEPVLKYQSCMGCVARLRGAGAIQIARGTSCQERSLTRQCATRPSLISTCYPTPVRVHSGCHASTARLNARINIRSKPCTYVFFLGIQGTSRPTKYAVLLDENNFTADELYSFTYNTCYTYYLPETTPS